MSGLERLFLIYCREHNAFLRPGAEGYTPAIGTAGRFSAGEARGIVNEANRAGPAPGHVGMPNQFHLPAPEALLEAFECGVLAGAVGPRKQATRAEAERVIAFTVNALLSYCPELVDGELGDQLGKLTGAREVVDLLRTTKRKASP